MASKKLADFTDDELIDMARRGGYADVKALRRAAFIEHVAAMAPEPRIDAWAQRMTAARGPLAGLHFHGRNHETSTIEPHAGLPWKAALLVARYGEAMFVRDPETQQRKMFWPSEWTEDDVERTRTWESGKKLPEGYFDIVVEGA